MILRFWEAVLERELRSPGRFLAGAVAALVLLGGLLLWRLELRTDIEEMVPTASARALERIDCAFGAGRKAFIIVSDPAGSEERLVRFAREVESSLSMSLDIESVEWGYGELAERILDELALPWGPLFAAPPDLAAIEKRLTPEGVALAVERLALQLRLPGLSPLEALAAKDPLEMGPSILARFAPLRGAFRFHPASLHALSADGRSLLITATGRAPVKDLKAAKRTADRIEEALRSALASPWAWGMECAATGGYLLAAESERVVRRDVTASVFTSAILVLLLSWASLRGVLPVLLGMAVLLLGLVAGLACLSLLFRPVDALALGAGAILVGLGIDFVAHLASAALAARARGESAEGALRAAVREVEPGMRFSALTTGAAFLTFLLARQGFLRQMGLLAALGVLFSYAAALGVYPALLAPLLRRSSRTPGLPRALGLGSLSAFALRRPRAALAGAALLSAGALLAIAARPPGIETDLRNIHARSSPALEAQERIRGAFGSSAEPMALLIEGAGEEELVEAARRLAAPLDALVVRGEISGWVSIAQLIPPREDQARAIEVLRKVDGEALARAFESAIDRAGFEKAELAAVAARLEALDRIREPLTAAELRRTSLGKAVDGLLARDGGRALALAVAYPPQDLWSEEARARAVEAVAGAARAAGVKAELASIYTVSAESAREVTEDFARISLLAASAVAVLVALQFPSLGRTLPVLLPVALGCLWMAGAFALLGFKLNFMNLTVLPMVIGTGVDSGIHLMSRFLGSGRGARASVAGALPGVAVAALTTMAGFGSLALSANRGLASVGIVSLIGMGSCLAAAAVALPAALALLERRGAAGRRGLEEPRP